MRGVRPLAISPGLSRGSCEGDMEVGGFLGGLRCYTKFSHMGGGTGPSRVPRTL